ncbi:MAG: hypothetical protein HY000_18050 [Planctomycetes bacterium]|nr:hypothetical protein [Planctomycetota bacterium]
MKTQQIDVTKSTQRVGESVRGLSPITQPIEILLEGKVVGRVVPPGELSEAEKEDIVRNGWEAVQEARARNKGVPEKEIGKVIDAAVRRVRARK